MLATSMLIYSCESNSGGAMQSTEIGNRYQLFSANGSGEIVQPGDYVYFHAIMRTEGDSVLFSTRDGGADNLPVVQAPELTASKDEIGPVEDVVRQMRVGDSAVVRVNIEEFPSKPPGMENDTVVIYDVIVSEIVSEEEFSARAAAKEQEAQAKRELVITRGPERVEFATQVIKDYQAGKLDDQIQETPSGLKYIIHEKGDGKEAEAGLGVVVQYIGQLVADASIFDQSFERGSGIPFQLGTGRVIPGWDEGIDLLQVGDKATFFIPSELGYGAEGTPDGSIPGGAELGFYVELEDVQ